MDLFYEVTSKVETLRMDGETTFLFHGKLSFGWAPEQEALSLALTVPFDVWSGTDCGERLTFHHGVNEMVAIGKNSITD